MHVVVVGAGLAGLVGGGALRDAGHTVTLLERSAGPGGRLATRRIGAATLDHGAQFFTVRDDAFAGMVRGWERDGLVEEWCRGFGPVPDGYPRYRVAGGMNALAKHLARGHDLRLGSLVFGLRPEEAGWEVLLDDGAGVAADAVVLTCPVPQSYSLLVTAGLGLPDGFRGIDYDRALALLAVLNRSPGLAPPGAVQGPEGVFSWLADNQAKGISAVPAMTFHASSDWSAAHWDDPRDEVHAALLDAAGPWLGPARVVESQVKRWRFAAPVTTWPRRCHVVDDAPAALVLAGDAFAGPRVEGAALSGLAAARALL